ACRTAPGPARAPRCGAPAARAALVEPLGLDERDRHVTIEPRVVRHVDALLPPLADEAADVVAAAAERRGCGFRCGRPLGAHRLRRERRPAAAAQLLSGLGLEAAGRPGGGELRPARRAVATIRPVAVSTGGAAHLSRHARGIPWAPDWSKPYSKACRERTATARAAVEAKCPSALLP